MEDKEHSFSSIIEAKSYLVRRIISQAAKDNVPLDATEIKMLSWSTANEDPEMSWQYAQRQSIKVYEKKIEKLISRCCQGNIREKAVFRKASLIIGEGNHYINVMLKKGLRSSASVGADNLPGYIVVLVVLVMVAFLWGLTEMDQFTGNPIAPPMDWPESSRLLWWPFVVVSISQLASLLYISFKIGVRGWRIRENDLLLDLGINHSVALKYVVLSWGVFLPLLGAYVLASGIFERYPMAKEFRKVPFLIYFSLLSTYWLVYWDVQSSNQAGRDD